MNETIHRHCGVSLLRAQRLARGLTLVQVAVGLTAILRRDGEESDGVTHQTVSRWEKRLDMPSNHFLSALCRLYRTRTDRPGFGADWSDGEGDEGSSEAGIAAGPPLANSMGGQAVPTEFLPALFAKASPRRARVVVAAVRELEERTARSGYLLNVLPPSVFVEARMHDLAETYGLLRIVRPEELRRRLYRVEAKNAGFIAGRLSDVSDKEDSLPWFRMAHRAARKADDAALEAWIYGYLSYAHVGLRHSLDNGLAAARRAQAIGGPKPSSARVLGLLAEAGVQASLGRRREALNAVREAEQIQLALPGAATMADGIGASEYRLRWHQAHVLSAIGEHRHAAEMRARAMELPQSEEDLVGLALLQLDHAVMLIRMGEVEHGCALVRQVARSLPQELRNGQVPQRIARIQNDLPPAQRQLLWE